MSKPGRPVDLGLRDRIEAIRREHPKWSQRQVAAAVPCAWRTVAKVMPRSTPAAKGLRVTIPAELAAKAAARGGVVAVLLAALADPARPPVRLESIRIDPPLRTCWIPGER